MIKKTINAWLVTVLMISICLAADKSSVDKEMSKSREEKLMEIVKAKDAAIEFYGKVIDQFGDPVQDASVTIQMSYFSPMALYFRGVKDLLVQTDKKGSFELKNVTGDGILITKVEKKGYEFLGNKVERNYDFFPGAQKKHHPDKTNPVIFTMRKKEPPTLVIPFEFGFGVGPKKKVEEREIDLVQSESNRPGYLAEFIESGHTDLLIKAEVSDNGGFLITFTTPDGESGITERNEVLYIVPEQGYEPTKVIIIPANSDTQKHIYIKSRRGGVYARLDLNIKATKEELNVNIQSWANPTGSRNVDLDKELYRKELERRMEERHRKAIEREERKKLKEQK